MNKKIRNMFPMLKNNLTYLDSAALVQKPISTINAISDFYQKYSISDRSSDSKLGIFVNKRINETKELVSKLLGCDSNEIIFNSGTTDGLNYASYLLEDVVNEGDQIVLSKFNHSSNMIPWIELAKKTKAKIVFSNNVIEDINSKTKIVAYAQENNNFKNSISSKEIWEKANKYNSIIINDAAQAISYQKVHSKYAHIICFSANKLFGPTGLGIMYIQNDLLKKLSPKKFGGGSINNIFIDGTWDAKNEISKHEPGTPNLAAIFGFYESLIFFSELKISDIQKYLFDLSSYAYEKLSQLKKINIHSKKGDHIILIDVENFPSQDVCSYLGHNNIYVRSGYFCAHYLKNLNVKPLIRISLQIYNNKEDIDTLVNLLEKDGDFLDFI